MTPQDIEAGLSYAYLHAVASRAGVACQESVRTVDNAGIDASLHLVRDFGSQALLSEITLHIQLKATINKPAISDKGLSYHLRSLDEYDRLRRPSATPQRLLGVLFLPADESDWLVSSPEALLLRHCAYWVSLLGAPASQNDRGQTVYLPESNRLSPEGLIDLFRRVARREELRYAA